MARSPFDRTSLAEFGGERKPGETPTAAKGRDGSAWRSYDFGEILTDRLMAQAEADSAEEHEPSLEAQRAIIALCLLLLAGLSWVWLYRQLAELRAVAMMAATHSGTLTTTPAFWSYVPGNSLLWFMVVTAMMLPSITPTIFLYTRFRLASRDTVKSTLVIVAAYLGIWAGFSLIAALAQFLLVRFGVASQASLAIGDKRIMGVVLVLAGLYQFSRLKAVCLESCRSPLPFVMRLWRPGWRGALNIGAHHGLHCLGCSWLLMALLFVGGLMNLTWVVALAILVLIEKTAPYGHRIGQAVGVIALVWGVVLLVASAI
jgi:predicted metal-binding membrane protein